VLTEEEVWKLMEDISKDVEEAILVRILATRRDQPMPFVVVTKSPENCVLSKIS
jgi:hypothetical protein